MREARAGASRDDDEDDVGSVGEASRDGASCEAPSGGDSLGSFAPSEDLAPPPTERRATGGELARYRVDGELGAGGMGVVWRVHDRRLLRDVAWKRGDWRLLREARVLAQLEHPGIVPIHDLGFGDDGEPYFAMRIVRGRSLSEVLRQAPSAERMALLRPLHQAASAVAYAHHRGVVHRDLKPGNLMIGPFGESQVVDWGLARVLDEATDPLPAAVRDAVRRVDAAPVGTPGYMSPEQVAGEPADRRSDVFGLGRILARLVAPDPDAGAAAAPPELQAIVAKATATAPADRYPDAAAFADDLGRYLDGHRVAAHAYRPRELLRRFVRAYRVPLAIAALALVALAVSAVVYVARLDAERARSDHHLARSLVGEARRLAATGARAEAEVLAARSLALGEDADARGVLAALGGGPTLTSVGRAPLACESGDADPVRGLVLCSTPDGVALWSTREAAPRLLWSRALAVRVAALADGRVVVGTSSGPDVVALDLEGRQLFRRPAPNDVARKASTLGSRVVIESGHVVTVVDLARGDVVGLPVCGGGLHAALVPARGPASGAAALDAVLCRDGSLHLGPDTVATPLVAPAREGFRMALVGDRVVVGTTKGEVTVLDRAGHVVRSDAVTSGMVRLLAPSPDGRWLAVAGERDPIVIVTLPDLARVAALPRRCKHATWDAERPSELVSTGVALERWRLSPPPADRPLRGAYSVPLDDGVVALDIDPREPERLVAAIGPEVGVLSPERLATAALGFVTVKGAAIGGRDLVLGGALGLIAVDPLTLAPRAPKFSLSIRRVVPLDDGTTLVATYDQLLRSRGPDALTALVPVVDGAPLDLAVAPGRRFAVLLRERDRALIRVASGAPGYETLGLDPRAEAAALAQGGDRVFTARSGEVAEWGESGQLVALYDAHATPLVDVEVSPDGHWVAAGGRDGVVYLWASGEPEPRARAAEARERVPALAFSADGRWLAAGSWDRTLRLYDLATLEASPEALARDLERRYDLDLGEALGGPSRLPDAP